MTNLEKLRKQALDAQKAVAEEVARIQAECTHSIATLSYRYSGVTSSYGLRTEHHMDVECTCGKIFQRSLVIHDDP